MSTSSTYQTEVGYAVYLCGSALDFRVDPVHVPRWAQDDVLAGVDESHCPHSHYYCADPYAVDQIDFIKFNSN